MRDEKYVSRDTSDKERAQQLFKKMHEKLHDKEYFTLGNVTHDKMLGFKLVETLKPLFKQFMREGLIEEAGKEGRYRFTNQEIPEDFHDNEDIDEELTEEDKAEVKSHQEKLEDEIKKYKRFIITTAVREKEVNEPFLNSIKNFAERKEALILILPCKGKSRRRRGSNNELPVLDESLTPFRKVYKDVYLNKNLCIAAVDIPATAINPLSGMDRIVMAKEASIILPSPKIFLKHIPNMHFDIPPAIMTTGAVTKNQYDSNKYMSKKSEYLAESDHAYGAIIVEIENERIFHFRHVLASKEGSFIDLGTEYLPDGSIHTMKNNAMVMGDSHIGYHDLELHYEALRLAYDTDVKEIILHDIFHGSSVSHHDAGKGVTNAIKANENRLGLEKECIAVKNYLSSITSQGFKVTVVKSNHDNHLFRYLDEGRFKDDTMNYAFSLKLALAAVEKKDPLQYAIEEELHYKDDNLKWLQEDEGYKIYGVEVSHHGSTGANGSRGSLALFEKGLGNCVTAHTHSAAIIRNAYCVGTVGLMDMKYNKGLSSWTRTCCVIYSNGTKQLINFIPDGNGNYSYRI